MAKFRGNGEREGCWRKRVAEIGGAGVAGGAGGGACRVREGGCVFVFWELQRVLVRLAVVDR